MNKVICFALALVILTIAIQSDPSPPVWSPSFKVSFDQSYKIDNKTYKVNGQKYYDATNNRQRTDRVNGRYNLFCGTVLPNVTTSCQLITTNNKRYIVYPEKSQCCFCCDSSHGCGILKRNWLDGAKYMGTQKIVDTTYDKWSKDGDVGYNYYWDTTDSNHIPRRLDENGEHITDYLTNTYLNQTLPDSIFALPKYCSPQNSCPSTSICGKLRQK